MSRFNLEIGVGIFLVLGFLCFSWISVRLGDVSFFGPGTYQVSANFGSISGLREGAVVEIAGVPVGEVSDINLDQEYYEAEVFMSIREGVKISEDSIASIRTAGIIGDRYVSISPGGALDFLSAGGKIQETESAINLEELLGKYIFEKE
jgi:phospholipid/cholesterol/gamma-HCH transport system substrate-binding protein